MIGPLPPSQVRLLPGPSRYLFSQVKLGLNEVLHRTRVHSKDTIFRQGMPISGWYILCHGRAKLVLSTARSKRLLLWFGKPGDILNFSVFGHHAFSAVAVDSCLVGFIERNQVLGLFRRYPELWKELHHRLSLWERHLAQRFEDLRALDVRERLVRVLLELGEEHGVKEPDGLRIDLPLSLRDLADMVGSSP